jgi:hypothetical protein
LIEAANDENLGACVVHFNQQVRSTSPFRHQCVTFATRSSTVVLSLSVLLLPQAVFRACSRFRHDSLWLLTVGHVSHIKSIVFFHLSISIALAFFAAAAFLVALTFWSSQRLCR